MREELQDGTAADKRIQVDNVEKGAKKASCCDDGKISSIQCIRRIFHCLNVDPLVFGHVIIAIFYR